jgi:hypothetical protein
MKTYETNLKPAGRIAALLLAISPGLLFGQAQAPPTRLSRLAAHKSANAAAPRAANPSTSVAAERYVFGRADLAVGNGPLGVAIGAFQTGGPQSLAVANSGANTVSILLGNPDGTYQAAVDYPTGLDEVQTVITGDFNGDHNPDLALAAYDSDTVAILLGNGDGTFQPAVNYPAGAKDDDFSLAAADFNRDGHLDLAVLNTNSDTVSILLGNGDGTFQPPVTYATGDSPAALAVADFNGDGVPDLAVPNLDANTVSILLGNGDGTFKPQVQYVTGPYPVAVAVGDFNGDGKLDLATADSFSNTVSVLLGNGDGTFQAHVDYDTGINPVDLVAGDFNGDGKLDLAVTNSFDNTISVLLGKGNGTFQKQVVYGTGFSPEGLAAADLNGDGKLDLAIANSSANTVSILIGEGNGTFQTHADSATGQQPYDVAIADFNGDGKPDLASANFAANSASILLNEGSGKFAAHVDYPTGYASGAVAIADFNGDNKQDLAVTATGSNAVSILLGNGDGTFQAQREYPTGNLDIGIAVGDFTGKGVADVVTSNSAFGSNSVSILLGTGTGAFQPFVNYASGFFPLWTAVADFNGDGKLDLAVADTGNVELGFAYPSQVSILLGNGDGTFQSPIIYDVGDGADWITAGDFNQDGKQDLAVVNSDDNTVSILLGNGDGTFQPQVSYAVGVEPYSAAVADFNGDGIPDLAVSNSICLYKSACGPGTVSILLGNGDGTFQPDVEYVVGLAPSGLAAGDLNGQGGADVAVANVYSNSVSVLFNLPVISVFPNTVAFAKEAVGKMSPPRTVTIGNPSGTPIGFTSIKVAGADPGDFAETNTCPVSPATLAPGATCSVAVTFTPTASGKRNGKIELTDTVPGSPQSITLTGSGT